MKRNRGFALVLVLIISALLVALITEFVRDVFVDTSHARSFVSGQQASLLAEAGVTGTIELMKQDRKGITYTSLKDRWATPLVLSDDRGTVRVTVEEESGKLNLNAIAQPRNGAPTDLRHLFDRLTRQLQLSGDLGDALADWLDSDSVALPAGAEESYYQQLKPPVTITNGQLVTLGELSLVKGFAGVPYQRLASLVTVYYDSAVSLTLATININTAPQEVLAALDDGMDPSLVKRILAHREKTPFTTVGELRQVAGMDTLLTPALQSMLTVKGSVYRITSQGEVGGVTRSIEAVVRFDGQGATMLAWREE